MYKDRDNFFWKTKVPTGLFDKILIAIKKEQELRQTKKIALGFLLLLIMALGAAPFSTALMVEQIDNSGVIYFVRTVFDDPENTFGIWKEVILAIVESLPITAIVIFVINIIVATFTLRLFLHRKKLLIEYFKRGMSFA